MDPASQAIAGNGNGREVKGTKRLHLYIYIYSSYIILRDPNTFSGSIWTLKAYIKDHKRPLQLPSQMVCGPIGIFYTSKHPWKGSGKEKTGNESNSVALKRWNLKRNLCVGRSSACVIQSTQSEVPSCLEEPRKAQDVLWSSCFKEGVYPALFSFLDICACVQ